jgi:hypothetical protein
VGDVGALVLATLVVYVRRRWSRRALTRVVGPVGTECGAKEAFRWLICQAKPGGRIVGANLILNSPRARPKFALVTVETFKHEIAEALKAYDKYIICLDKAPEDCANSLRSLMDKAIKAYRDRAPGLRHGIALDRHVTIILSQAEGERPLCAIYFNLHSPYHKKSPAKAIKAEG